MPELNESIYIPLHDFFAMMQKCANDLTQLSPHPTDQCTVGVAKELVERMVISLIRTPSVQRDHVCPEVKDVAEVEAQLGKRAAQIARTIVDLQRANDLTAEKYVELLSKSPLPNLTRAAVHTSRIGSTHVHSKYGDYVTRNAAPVSNQVPCSESQRLTVRVESFQSCGRMVRGRVTGYGLHAEFWQSLSDPRIDIEVLDQSAQQGLLLSRILEEDVELELSISISLQHGRRSRDVCNASLLGMPNLAGLLVKAIRRLNSQLALDLRFPDPGGNLSVFGEQPARSA